MYENFSGSMKITAVISPAGATESVDARPSGVPGCNEEAV